MTNSGSGNLQLSQGYEVLAPKSGQAYPVPCDEWRFLKERLSVASAPPWILPALSFMLLGACLATFITIILGGVNVVIITGVIGLSTLWLTAEKNKLQDMQVREVLRQMDLIENRFDKDTS
jgi:hypothetical protein